MSWRAALVALAVGFAVGLTLGLVYAWQIAPVELYNTTPPLLRSDYRHDWIRMAALGYVADGDQERARIRLEGLRQEDLQTALAALIESYAAQGRPAETMRALSRLAQELGVSTAAMQVYLGTPPPTTPVAALSPTPTAAPPLTVPPPTATPTVFPFLTLPSPYRAVSQTLVCGGASPRLQVFVRVSSVVEETERGEVRTTTVVTPLTGVTLWLLWPGGADRAVTGLRPQIDPGYADFTLQPGVPYALSVGGPDAPVISGLTVQPCPTGEAETASWVVVVEPVE